jgi:N-sulfoglucosamine sulfohydrolase
MSYLIHGTFLLCAAIGWGLRIDAAERPNVLLITSEDHSPHLSCYGDANIVTPNLDALAAEGMRLANAFVTYSVCSPSRASILTGLYPHQNGQIGLATHKYAMYRDWPNIASLLSESGYRTGIIGKLHVNPAAAFPFDFQALPGSNFNDRPMEKFADLADGFIREGDGPFFLMVNYPDAHVPFLEQEYGLPAEPLSATDVHTPWPEIGADSPRLRGQMAAYYNCLLRLDAGIGMLLARLRDAGAADNTLVIYLSDHGAQFSRGKTTSYEFGLRVPMIVRWPGRIESGLVREQLVSSIDILPTILEAVGIEAPAELPGRSLSPLIDESDPPWRKYVFSSIAGSTAYWTFPQRTVRDERYKLILNLTPDRPSPSAAAYEELWQGFRAGCSPEEIAAASEEAQRAYETYRNPPAVELYDLETDPNEFVNLSDSAEYVVIRDRLLGVLDDWRAETSDPFVDPRKLERYLGETARVSEEYGGSESLYRRDPAFRWEYLDYLAPVDVR